MYTNILRERANTNVFDRSTLVFQYNLCSTCTLKKHDNNTIIGATDVKEEGRNLFNNGNPYAK